MVTPRQAYQHAFTVGWIADEQLWDEMIRARNSAVHIYREEEAEALYERLAPFQQAFEALLRAIK